LKSLPENNGKIAITKNIADQIKPKFFNSFLLGCKFRFSASLFFIWELFNMGLIKEVYTTDRQSYKSIKFTTNIVAKIFFINLSLGI
jgi:hypothetical protein